MNATEPKLKPQCATVLRHLETDGPLTDARATSLYGIARLGARVWDLRRAGHAVQSRLIRVRTRHGDARVAEYYLPGRAGR